IPAVQAACGATRIGRIGVIGTTATIKSSSYGRAIRAIRPDAFVVGNSCPLFVPLVENGFTDSKNAVTKLVAEQYLAPIIAEKVDTLILGCTHYPIIKDIIAEIMGEGVRLISPGEEAAKNATNLLSEKEMLTDRTEKGRNEFYVSDSAEMFGKSAKTFLGREIDGEIHTVDVDSLLEK
ncbi:MAG: aspartate/glutamate racemase family protein, partial [Oscillospiraceae bacterium]